MPADPTPNPAIVEIITQTLVACWDYRDPHADTDAKCIAKALAAAGRLLPADAETRAEWGVRLTFDDGNITEDECPPSSGRGASALARRAPYCRTGLARGQCRASDPHLVDRPVATCTHHRGVLMARVRPSSALHNLGRQERRPGDHQISTCKRCRLGIFNRQPRVWRTGQMPGLVHVDCNNPNGEST